MEWAEGGTNCVADMNPPNWDSDRGLWGHLAFKYINLWHLAMSFRINSLFQYLVMRFHVFYGCSMLFAYVRITDCFWLFYIACFWFSTLSILTFHFYPFFGPSCALQAPDLQQTFVAFFLLGREPWMPWGRVWMSRDYAVRVWGGHSIKIYRGPCTDEHTQ